MKPGTRKEERHAENLNCVILPLGIEDLVSLDPDYCLKVYAIVTFLD